MLSSPLSWVLLSINKLLYAYGPSQSKGDLCTVIRGATDSLRRGITVDFAVADIACDILLGDYGTIFKRFYEKTLIFLGDDVPNSALAFTDAHTIDNAEKSVMV
jgi:hypothetical protein